MSDNLRKEIDSVFIRQLLPILLTFVIFLFLSFLTYTVIIFLNIYIGRTDIFTKLRWEDILVGMTIYLKTSVDFGILIGNLMTSYNHWKDRIAIEIGTALGNGLGTILVLIVWDIFRNVKWLLIVMIAIASIVLFKLAEEGLEHVKEKHKDLPKSLVSFTRLFELTLKRINKTFSPLFKFLIPNLSMKPPTGLTFFGLFMFSFTVPFILGLDDFAGYIPLFDIVKVFGFAIGVYAGHMILNIALFVSPKKTVAVVKNPIISLVGSIAFVGIAIWGLLEVFKLALLH